MSNHLVIPDTQVKPGVDISHILAAARLAAMERPDVIVVLGDWWDFPSLSSYDKSTRKAEGARYVEDLDAGNSTMKKFLAIALKPKSYSPELIFCEGNHEWRAERYMESNPELDGVFGMKDFHLPGFKVFRFKTLAEVDGVNYCHFMPAKNTGKALTGSAMNILKKKGFSFTQGHRQDFDIARWDLANGQAMMGMIVGAFYTHDEDYKGPQGNREHWRGLVMKYGVENGRYDYETYSIERLMQHYG